MNLEARTAALLARIADYRDDECRALLKAAEAEAQALLTRTWRAERARLHARVLAERAAALARIQAALAECDTRRRAKAEQTRAEVLGRAWPLLVERLVARWQDPGARGDWATAALNLARQSLPPGDWTIRHAPGGTDPEWAARGTALAEGIGALPRCMADPGLRAGLVIEAGGVRLDASLDGLLGDRPRIEARLLALLADGASDSAPEGSLTPTRRAGHE
jgi:hypothetical protein